MLSQIQLNNIKIHTSLTLNFNKKITILHGDNGIGKTSILEAISIFTLGKGIFNIEKSEILKKDTKNFNIQIIFDEKKFIYKYDTEQNKKQFLFRNTQISPKILVEHIKLFGLSPYISLAFWHDIEIRRKIINRIILQHCPEYAIYFKEYINTMKKRNLLIKNNTFNTNWSAILDPILIKNGQIINKIRQNIIKKHINKHNKNIYNFLNDDLILEMEPNYEEQNAILEMPLSLNFLGPHLTKFMLKTQNNINTSTGQEKKLLLSLLIMNAIAYENSILLLDDLFHNLDDYNVQNLIELLNIQNFQTIITNTKPINHCNVENIQIL